MMMFEASWWLFLISTQLANNAAATGRSCSPKWILPLRDISLILPLDLVKPNDLIFQLQPFPSSECSTQVGPRGKSYLRMKIESNDNWNEPPVQLNSQTGQLLLSNSGLKRGLTGGSIKFKVSLEPDEGNEASITVSFTNNSLCAKDIVKGHFREILTLPKYKFEVPENMKGELGGFSPTSHLLSRCTSNPRRMSCSALNEEYAKIDENGNLILVQGLDREDLLENVDEREARVEILVKCFIFDQADQVLTSFRKKVTIVVKDVNDNAPFPQQREYSVEVQENVLKKGETLRIDEYLLFDRDLPASNEYEVEFPDQEDSPFKVESHRIGKMAYRCNSSTSALCPCQGKNCIFRGTILYLQDCKFRAKRDIAMHNDKSFRIPVTIRNKRNTEEESEMSIVITPSFKVVYTPPPDLPRTAESIDNDYSPLASSELKEEEHNYSVSVPSSASRFTRVFDFRPLFGRPRKLKIVASEWVTTTSTTEKAAQILALTSEKNILYVSNPDGLKSISLASKKAAAPVLQVSLEGVRTKSLRIFLNVTFEDAPMTNSCRHDDFMACSEFSMESECLTSCGGHLSPTGSCQWVPRSEGGSSYSTCSNDLKTCPDRFCDSLEKMDISICPQDCMSKQSVGFNLHFKNDSNWRQGLGEVKSPDMVCTCDQSSCSCIHKNDSHSLLKELDVTKPTTEMTGTTELQQEPLDILEVILPTVAFCLFSLLCIIFCHNNIRVFCDGIFKGKTERVILASHSMISLSSDENRNSRGQNGAQLPSGLAHNHRHRIRRHFSGTSSTFTFGGPSSLSTASTNLSSTNQLNNIHEMRVFSPSNDTLSGEGDDFSGYYHQIEKKWEYPRKNLIFEKVIGEGEFGKVMSARALDRSSASGYKRVAVKMLKSNHSKEEVHDLLAEFNILKEVNHANVIGVFGACTSKGGPVCIIMEFAEHGSLRDYLRQSRGIVRPQPDNNEYVKEVQILSPKDLLTFAWQIAKGMEYLSNMKFVHRDLAARNVLLSAEMVCKISDFGLTRDVYIDDAYWKKSNGRIPVKWLSPESLRDHLYTTKSDVWSYGVLLWELVTLGNSPYPGLQPERLLHVLSMGYRMQRPDNCSEELYNLMTRCWEYCPDQRPTFPDLVSWTQKLLLNSAQYLDLSPNIVNNVTYLEPLGAGDNSKYNAEVNMEASEAAESDRHEKSVSEEQKSHQFDIQPTIEEKMSKMSETPTTENSNLLAGKDQSNVVMV